MAWKLYYDGGCNLCHASRLRAERWAQRAGVQLSVDVLASDEAIRKGFGPQMTLVVEDRTLTAADAWMRLMTIAPWYLRWIAWLRHTGPTMALARAGYGLVARFRYVIFGRRACSIEPKPITPRKNTV